MDAQRGGRLHRGADEQLVDPGLRCRVTPHQVERHPVRAPGDELQQAPDPSVLARGDEDRVRVEGVGRAAQRHREAALGLAAAPGRRVREDGPALVRGEVGHAAYPGVVARPPDATHHLADVAHRAALEGEVRDLEDRLVAELHRREVGEPGPRESRPLAAAEHGRRPRVVGGRGEEGRHRPGPGLGVADRVPAGEHDATDDPIGDGGLARVGPDEALVAAQVEVAQRVRRPGQQLTHPALVDLGELGQRLGCAQQEIEADQPGHQAEAEQQGREDVVEAVVAQLQVAAGPDETPPDVLEHRPRPRPPADDLAAVDRQRDDPDDRARGEQPEEDRE